MKNISLLLALFVLSGCASNSTTAIKGKHLLESDYVYEDWDGDGVQDARLKPKAHFWRNGQIWYNNSWVKVLGVPDYEKSRAANELIFTYKEPVQVDGENGYFWDGSKWNIASRPSAFLAGAVKLPGLWALPEGNRLDNFVKQSGGLERWAVRFSVERDGEVIHESDISRDERLNGKLKSNYIIQPGDLVRVIGRVH